MSAIVQLIAVHGLAAGHLAAVPLTPAGAAPPNPAPQAPPGLQGPVPTMVAWGQWGVPACRVAAPPICAAKTATGPPNPAPLPAPAPTGNPWFLARPSPPPARPP